ncbi:hypothetical protein BDN72DRAFT_64586 [Pluteus cervinus]|uniref:Uncharacterized protein n=1 Tax=Pluteus cervinus TaxID=181527 RepID=A0ACD3ARC2_9AGAR|nr:hypothetical protein BDN72DRAFT_64586 [Pluteus cervinus]
MDVVPGGRWLLVPNAGGSILYYDLDAHDSCARVLIPEKQYNCLTEMSIDVIPACSYLRFNLALAFYFPRSSGHQLEVWQIDLVLDEHGQGTGLSACCQASFQQEPPGLCDSLSLLGDKLAFTTFYQEHPAVHTVVVDWKTVQGINHPKRVLHPSSRYSTRLLPGDVLIAANSCEIELIPCSSLPLLKTFPKYSWHMPEANRFLFPLEDIDEMTLSNPVSDGHSTRFVVGVREAVYGITLIPDSTQEDHGYQIEIVKLFKFSPAPKRTMCLSDTFVAVWSETRGLVVQRVSWSGSTETCFPIAETDRAAPFKFWSGRFLRLDMPSGRVLVDHLRANHVMVLDLSSVSGSSRLKSRMLRQAPGKSFKG